MRTNLKLAAIGALMLALPHTQAATVTAKNDADIARPSETIELSWADVVKAVPAANAKNISVSDGGKDVACQTVDLNLDGTPDQLIFQADFAPGESKTFTLDGNARKREAATKVYGRHVPERLDDFAWENDRVAFRMYGPALEKVEPGSSGVDAWCKRSREMVIDKWYKIAEPKQPGYYHIDHGEGLDCYKVGKGRGCGGDAIWKDGKIYDSGIKGWKGWKIIASGPIRLVFELSYDPYDANGEKVTEVRRVTLDAGSNLNKFQNTFTSDKGEGSDLQIAIGLAKHGKPDGKAAMSKEQGWIRYWDACDVVKTDTTDNGNIGCGVVIDPAAVAEVSEINDHVLLIAKAKSGTPLTYWAGSGWDKSGDFKGVEDWDAYLANAAKRVASPLKVSVAQ